MFEALLPGGVYERRVQRKAVGHYQIFSAFCDRIVNIWQKKCPRSIRVRGRHNIGYSIVRQTSKTENVERQEYDYMCRTGPDIKLVGIRSRVRQRRMKTGNNQGNYTTSRRVVNVEGHGLSPIRPNYTTKTLYRGVFLISSHSRQCAFYKLFALRKWLLVMEKNK